MRQLAERCAEIGAHNLTQQVLTNIETGHPGKDGNRRRKVTVDELLDLARAFDVPISELFDSREGGLGMGGERRELLGNVGDVVRANVRTLRKSQRLTTEDLAAKMKEAGREFYATGVTKIEMGNRRVDVDDLVAIAAALGVEPQELLTPFKCSTCHGEPPAGFTCRTCGAG